MRSEGEVGGYKPKSRITRDKKILAVEKTREHMSRFLDKVNRRTLWSSRERMCVRIVLLWGRKTVHNWALSNATVSSSAFSFM